MFSKLTSRGILVPDGFATTAYAFEEFLTQNSLHSKLDDLIRQLDRNHYENLNEIGAKARELMLAGELPQKLQSSILQAYKELCGENDFEVAVRSSATAEDLPQASFAGAT
jgi:pyruvate,water dikinase